MKKKSLIGLMALSSFALASCNVNVNVNEASEGENSASQISSQESIESKESNTSVESSENTSNVESSSEETSTSEEISSSEETSTSEEVSSSKETSTSQEKVQYKKSFVESNMSDFTKYEGTEHYVKVSTADELFKAIEAAKDDYTTTWDDATNTYTQVMNKEGNVSVIEITNDINLGWLKLSEESQKSSVTEDYAGRKQTQNEKAGGQSSDMLKENGITKIKVERINGLKIYSKNGAKLTHGGFQVSSSSDIEFSNLDMDEMWQWEDANKKTPSFKVGDYDVYGWAYFKISFSNNIYINNCSFGKSYDGQIDISDSGYWVSKNIAELRAPYSEAHESNITVYQCDFHAGSTSQDGYIYKMMEKIEQDYQANGENSSYQYYYALRHKFNMSFDQIFKAIAVPQKKAFLCGDRNNNGKDYNYYAKINFDSCKFTNIEDRLPKVRGGFVYMSNCLYDCTEYYNARGIIESSGAKNLSKDTEYNKKFKCGDTSQGIVASFEADVVCENCVFIGVKELLKNNENYEGNDVNLTDSEKSGGFMLINCLYDRDVTGSYTKLDTNENVDCIKGINLISAKEFNWHNDTNTREIQPDTLNVENLKEELATVGASK